MWKWIEHTLEDSEDFNFLFVAGHYMTIDSRGTYDRLVILLNPTLWIIRYIKYRACHTLYGSYIMSHFQLKMLGWQIASPYGKIQCSRQRFSAENELSFTGSCISYERIHPRPSSHFGTRPTTKRSRSKWPSLFHYWSRGSLLYKLHQKRYSWWNRYEYRQAWQYLFRRIALKYPVA